MTKYTELWNKTKNLIVKVSGKPVKYKKELIIIKFESDDYLPLIKLLKLHNLKVIVGSVFQEDNNCYPQIYLYECFF